MTVDYEKLWKEYVTYPTWLDNAIACLFVPCDVIHKATPLWQCAKHWTMGNPQQVFAGCGTRKDGKKGFFTFVRNVEVLVIPDNFVFELHVNSESADGILMGWQGQTIERQLIRELYFTNLVAVAKGEGVLLKLKGLKWPEM